MLSDKFFVTPNVFTSASVDGYELVTGSVPLSVGAKLLGFQGYSTADGYFQLFDGYAKPTNAAVPLLSMKVLASTNFSLDCSPYNCIPFSKGIVFAFSSTGPTYTDGNAHVFVTGFWI